MTPEVERIGRIIVEKGEGLKQGEKLISFNLHGTRRWFITKVPVKPGCPRRLVPDFSKWENFGKLLKVAKIEKDYAERLMPLEYVSRIVLEETYVGNIDQIPLLVATELARILEGK